MHNIVVLNGKTSLENILLRANTRKANTSNIKYTGR